MTSVQLFWTVAGAMALLAALLVLWPLLGRAAPDSAAQRDARRAENVAAYRQQKSELDAARDAGTLDADAHAAALLELDRRLLADAQAPGSGVTASRDGRALLLGAALAVPLLALLLYRQFGAYTEVELAKMVAELSTPMSPAERSERLARLLPLLEKQAARRDPEGDYRFLLARIDSSEGKHAAAAALFTELADQYPDDADLAAQAAQSLFLAEGGRLTPAVRVMAERALAIEPQHAGVHGMLGMASFQAGDYAAAIGHWQALLEQLAPDSPEAALIRDGIAAAQARSSAQDAPKQDLAPPEGTP